MVSANGTGIVGTTVRGYARDAFSLCARNLSGDGTVENVCMAKAGQAPSSHKPTVCAKSTSGTGDGISGCEGGACVVLFPQQEQLTR